MIISLDLITRKKLILVKQIYQRAVILAQTKHNNADRIFALVAFDLANETVLKAVVSALNPAKNPANDFPGIVSQAENEIAAKSTLSIPDKVKIQHVRTLRNDAQHKAKYPNESDINDCRTYTRDFLTQTFLDVWGENFESFSLIDAIQKNDAKKFLIDAEKDFLINNYPQSVVKSVIAFTQSSNNLADMMTESINPFVNQIMIGGVFNKPEPSDELFTAFVRTRQLVVFQSIGINTQEYLKYIRLTRFVYTDVREDGSYDFNFGSNHIFTKDEVGFILNFVTESILLIESIDDDVTQAYNHYG